MTTKTIQGETFTKVDDGTWINADGGEWIAEDLRDVRDKVRVIEKELAGITAEDLQDWDTAERWSALKDQLNTEEEDLEILEALFG